MRRSASAFDGRMRPGGLPNRWSCASAAEWNVRAVTRATPSASSRARISVAALSVNVTARIWSAENVPVATWLATRRVIVVVFPEPAPARMQTGPRTASTARRCSGFSPSKITRPPYGAGGTELSRVSAARAPKANCRGQTHGSDPRISAAKSRTKASPSPKGRTRLMERVFEDGRAVAAWRSEHRSKLGDRVERVAAFNHALQLGELLIELLDVDRRARGSQDLRMRRGADCLAVRPQLLVQLLAGAD